MYYMTSHDGLEYFEVEDLAKFFKTHPETIRRWVRSGKIKGKRIGRKWIFAKSYIKELLENGN